VVTRNIRPFSDFSEKGLFYFIGNFDEILYEIKKISEITDKRKAVRNIRR